MSGIKLTWDIGSFNPEKHYIYRSASPISPSNLPTPIAEVGQGINQYNDLSIVDGEIYHYFVAAEKMGLLCPADSSVSVGAINLGPGPQTLIGGDMTAGFFGETTTNELITGDALAAEIGLTAGVSQFNTEPWLKFAYNNNIVYISKKVYRHTVSWDDIYATGAVYGTDDNGLYPTGTPTNQNTIITKNGFNMKVTLPTGGNSDPSTGAGGMWNELLYNIHQSVGTWYSYTDTELHTSTGDGHICWAVEAVSGQTTNRVQRGYNAIKSYNSNNLSSRTNTLYGWRPVLELQL